MPGATIRDIAGFSRLTDTLLQHDQHGAEVFDTDNSEGTDDLSLSRSILFLITTYRRPAGSTKKTTCPAIGTGRSVSDKKATGSGKLRLQRRSKFIAVNNHSLFTI